MDVKDLRTESDRNNDGSKYSHGGVALQCNRNKSYQDIGSNSLAKTEPTPVRPCAVIGPDRVVPPPASSDAYQKKGLVEPWPISDNLYRRPPEYPHKISNTHPSRNISPRQTFQENMQRIMVPPTYNAVRHSDDANFNQIQDRNVALPKNVKPNVASEAKYCDVPYAINTLTSEPKNIRDSEMYMPSVNTPLTRTAPHIWPPASVNVHAPRPYGSHELYQYPQYPNCPGQRPVVIPMTRPHRTISDDPAYVYPEHYYQDANARFKSYPPVKERFPQPRYAYIGNYPNQFHPVPSPQTHKYDITKPGQSHPYPIYPHLKYVDNRVPEHVIEGYQRPTNQQPHYNVQFQNQLFQPAYAPVPGSSSQNKLHPYPPDGSVKSAASNKLHYDTSSKIYIDYENARNKTFPMTDSYFINEMGRVQTVKNQMAMSNYSSIGMHSVPPQQYFRKDNSQIHKPFEYMPHFRNIDPSLNSMMRHAPQFSPNTLAISPTDSNTSNDISQPHAIFQEDCGYVSQSSTASVRSMDSGAYRLPHEYYKKYDFRYGSIVGSTPTLTKSDFNSNNENSKDKQQQINVRQFLQMWNEGDEDSENNKSKEIVIQTGSSDTRHFSKQHDSNQDQLYVLGLVNVPSEELSKYEHIQKISKLPENIKGYNNLELLSQFEEAIESSKTPGFKSIPKEYQIPSKDSLSKQLIDSLPRPVSPLDVEAKISQSVIHKEVGCNFEIRPCSPKMLNVELAAPALNVLGERAIEKVSNPLSKIVKSPKPFNPDDNSNSQTKRQETSFGMNENPSCKMVRSPFGANNMDSIKTNYSLQDLDINSGVCLASLPRLDNEIEFNFPEVNQQFINANKKDTNFVIRHYARNDVEDETALSDSTFVTKDLEIKENASMLEEPEKTFPKLSKYRKMKVNSSDQSEKNQKTKVLRTDSVIIKNPENIKNIEDKLLENSFNTPINLSSQSSVCQVAPNGLESRDSDVDIALDFSLNKSGNDLPVIDIAQHISCENNELSDSSKSFNVNTTFHETIVSNLKGTVAECINAEVNEIKYVENTDVNMDIKASSNEATIKPQDLDRSIHTFLNNAVHDNALPSDKHLPVIHDASHGNTIKEEECKDTICVSAEEQNNECSSYNEAINTNYNIENEEKVPKSLTYPGDLVLPQQTEIVSNRQESGELMDFLTTENEVNNSINNEKEKSELVLSSKNKIDFENDEISATLEKIFQENTEDASSLNSSITSSESTVSMPVQMICCHKSKELYSPWIQKLLTNSEGLCSNKENAKVQNKTSKFILMVNKSNNINDKTYTDELRKEQSQNMNGEQNNEIKSGTVDEIFTKIPTEPTSTLDSSKSEPESIIKRCQLDTNTDSIKDVNILNCSKNKRREFVKTLKETDFSKHNHRPKEFVGEVCKINPEFNIETRNRTEESVLNILQDSECGKERSKSDLVNIEVLSVENQTKTINSTTAGESSETLDIIDSGNESVHKVENYFNIAILSAEDKDNKTEPPHCITTDFDSDSVNKNGKNVNNFQTFFNIENAENKDNNKIEIAHSTTAEESSKTLDSRDNVNKNSKNVNNVENVFNIEMLHVENKDNKTETAYCTAAGVAPEALDSRDSVSKPSNTIENYLSSPELTNFNSNDFSKQQVENPVPETTDDDIIMSEVGGDTYVAHELDIVQAEKKQCSGSLIQNVIITTEILDDRNIVRKLDNGEKVINLNNNLAEHETEENQMDNLGKSVLKICDTVETSKSCGSSKIDYEIDKIDQEHTVNATVESSSNTSIDNFAEQQTGEHQCGESLDENVDKSGDSRVGKTSEILDSSNIDCVCDSIVKDLNTPSFISIPNSIPDYCTEHQLDESQSRETVDEIATKKHKDSTDQISNTFNGISLVHEPNKAGLEDLSNNGPSNSVSNSCTKNQLEDNHISDENNTESKIVLIDNHIGAAFSVSDTSKNNQVPDIQIQEVDNYPVLEHVPNCISDKQVEHKKEECEKNIITKDKGLLPLCDDKKESICHQVVDHVQLENYALASGIHDAPANDKSLLPICNDEEKESICCQVVENDHVQSENYAFASDIPDAPANLRRCLKRSFSDSALNIYKNRDATNKQETENSVSIWPPKRQRVNEYESSEHQVIDENLSSFIQNTRRNSVCSFYNEENVSFCILIDDNCIITEENEEEKICFADISEDCITEVNVTNDEDDDINEIVCCSPVNQLDFSESVILNYENEKPIQENWLDDVACVETVVSDDILEDGVISTRVSPEDVEVSEIYNCDMSEETDVVNFINEETITDNITEVVETHKSHIGVDKMLYDEGLQGIELCNDFYGNKCLENILSEPISPECSPSPILDYTESALLTDDTTKKIISEGKENIFVADMPLHSFENYSNHNSDNRENKTRFSEDTSKTKKTETSCSTHDYDVLNTYDSSINRVFSYKGHDKDIISCTSSSSPEVSSTTSEEKSSCILLKITNYNGSRVSEVNEVNRNRPRCKFTEEKEYSNSHGVFPKRPLLTKAAQKYIPPIKETIRDLKVKLTLPQQSLLKLKQLKLSKNVPKVNKQTSASLTIPKKPKPNFEDVLKNIDKVQIKMHKEKTKKSKNIVPKVVIKKNVFGSHYTSSSNKNTFNPDMTGRKWQPWVFLEKNNFIDKMAINKNTKAIYSHRKKSYVLAEKFKKYKSVSNCSAKFVISHPKTGDSSKGQLKYTIRLKHSY